jgi:hypothetical protein
MRLRIRALRLRVQTESVLCGTDLRFDDGLVILRADNSSGKSTVVQSVIYGLGLEGMLSASHDVPLPHVMTDSIEIGSAKLAVLQSSVAVEIENASGKSATVLRTVKGNRNKNLLTVFEGISLANLGSSNTGTHYYVREAGAAANSRGFHYWFAEFVGWALPKVGRVDGTECPLYVECVFPLMIIEQKRGWSAIQARMPFHYRIRDVAKRSVEFLLALEVYDLALRRQRLQEQSIAIKAEWHRVAVRIGDLSRSVNGIAQNIDAHTPREITPEEVPVILVSRNANWLPLRDSLRTDIDQLNRLEQTEIPQVARVAQEVEGSLKAAETELSETEFTVAELFREIQNDQEQAHSLDERLAALLEDERRNRDVAKLKRMGSVEETSMARGQCPTCHQMVVDALLPQMQRAEPMTVEENLKFIRSQIDTFSSIKEAAASSLSAKQLRLESLRARAAEIRAQIRALRQTLVAEGSQPSIEAIERRLRLREKVNAGRRSEELIGGDFETLRKIGDRWKKNHEAIAALPKGDLTERDRQKIHRLREIFVKELQQFEFRSVDPMSLRISEENYRPEHDGFDLEFDISASDMIRTIWAYIHGLLELAREFPTNHLGLLILDEPKQQETARVSFQELFRRAGTASQHKQQVIIATSEDESTLRTLLAGVPHQYLAFSGRIVQPIERTP